MEVVIGMGDRSMFFDIVFGLVIGDKLLPHHVGDDEGGGPWNSSIAMEKDSSFFSSILDEFIDLIKELDDFLTLVIEDIVVKILEIFILFFGQGILTNRYNCMNFVRFEDVLVHSRVTISQHEGTILFVLLEDDVPRRIFVIYWFLHRLIITLFAHLI